LRFTKGPEGHNILDTLSWSNVVLHFVIMAITFSLGLFLR